MRPCAASSPSENLGMNPGRYIYGHLHEPFHRPLHLKVGLMEDCMALRSPRLGRIWGAAAFWLWASTLPALAQPFDVGGDYLVGLPRNDFRDAVDKNGYGFSGHFGYFLGKAPILIGADFGFVNWGIEKQRASLGNAPAGVTVDLRTSTSALMLHTFARLQPQQGVVRPYIEGVWGWKHLSSRISITNDSVDMATASSARLSDWAGSWGGGAGVDLRIRKSRQEGIENGGFEVTLNLSARYLMGGEAAHLDRGSILRNSDGTASFATLQSKTDVLMPQAGIRLRF